MARARARPQHSPPSIVLRGEVGCHLEISCAPLGDFCATYGTLTMQLCEQAAGSSMADRPGGTGRHTEPAKIGTRARTVLWVATNSTVTLVLTGDGMVDDPESSAVSASSAPSGQRRGAPKKDKCRRCSKLGNRWTGIHCPDCPGHAAGSTAAAAYAGEAAATTPAAVPAAASSAADGAEEPAVCLTPSGRAANN